MKECSNLTLRLKHRTMVIPMENKSPSFFAQFTPLPENLNPQILYFWKAPLRAYKKRSKNVLRFYLAVAILLSLIIYFLGDTVLVIPVWSILFLFYMLTITPPPIVTNKITKFGIETAGITLKWEILSHFYFTERFGFSVLTLVTQAPYYMHAYMIIPDFKTKKDVTKILAEHIMYQVVPRLGLTDRLIGLLSYLIPDDEEEDVPAKIMPEKPATRLDEVKNTLASFFQKQKERSLKRQPFEPSAPLPHRL
jgi:hypothetical protein